jgi:hypothetical protein
MHDSNRSLHIISEINPAILQLRDGSAERGLLAGGLQSSLPSPPNDVGINLMAGPDAAPGAVDPTTGKRKDVRAIVIFTK